MCLGVHVCALRARVRAHACLAVERRKRDTLSGTLFILAPVYVHRRIDVCQSKNNNVHKSVHTHTHTHTHTHMIEVRLNLALHCGHVSFDFAHSLMQLTQYLCFDSPWGHGMIAVCMCVCVCVCGV